MLNGDLFAGVVFTEPWLAVLRIEVRKGGVRSAVCPADRASKSPCKHDAPWPHSVVNRIKYLTLESSGESCAQQLCCYLRCGADPYDSCGEVYFS